MKRVSIGGGRWFNEDTATVYDEDTFFDGRNMISKATGSQWEHERLYRTASGAWILYAWSQWQGSRESYTRVSDERAWTWLIDNGHEEAVPAGALAKGEV